ncbi:hypothetical protein SERLA73DRAFT_188202 [Serpula lacrymans var. lacrymans S7.3]|uniref:Uncharacterized protein n=2 Tax=Serpula lacrymans var. lacrymans TaxID=341189 RepID=F8QAX2_SERL3|nr:uncharacterized protein SERLADRAFT_478238 [Serpula lacrymans var. lacrymans S7.9]EGN94358.1 hypothetical protein SERLA73DRAFT_188202 [Serpula lacrymans var. lacrymans S7.3]EGO19840.1 hypothetical protein SERLADRAFT_478238 [Serpula lacrymans var. lacrymans S7.9]
MSRPMNDDEVLAELNKMVAFIRQEAMEKAREIRVKADEEFAIEKAKLVKQEQQAIDAQFEKKQKGSEIAQKITQSNLTNKSRLQVLHCREEQLQDLFLAARSEILTFAEDEGRYTQFLEGVIVQGYLQLLEPNVTLHARERDADVVARAAESASQVYNELSGRTVKFEVETTLSKECAGGIKLTSGTRRINIDNTLDERLRLLEDRVLPEIRKDLFGPNENRKFYT